MAAKKTEDGIREYLNSLGKSAKPVVDKGAVKSLKAEIRTAADPIQKLKLMAALDVAEQGVVPDHSGAKAVFVSEARAWAESEGIKPEFIAALGVPDDVLKAAGFTVAARPAPPKRQTAARAPRLNDDEVLEAAKNLGGAGEFKLSDLADAIGRSPATTRNYVVRLVEAGTIKEVGDDPNHQGRGRAPKLYKVAS
jgi:hypothetical protein